VQKKTGNRFDLFPILLIELASVPIANGPTTTPKPNYGTVVGIVVVVVVTVYSLPRTVRDPSLSLTQFCAQLKSVVFSRAQ